MDRVVFCAGGYSESMGGGYTQSPGGFASPAMSQGGEKKGVCEYCNICVNC